MGNELQRLAVMQALYKELGKQLSTRDPYSLRSTEDAALLARYAEDGTDRRRININGEQVGTLTVRLAKARPRAIVEDHELFAEWLVGEGASMLAEYVRDKGQAIADWLIERMDGELPDGVTAYMEPSHPDGTVLKGCEMEDVVSALGLNLTQAVAYALTEGEVE